MRVKTIEWKNRCDKNMKCVFVFFAKVFYFFLIFSMRLYGVEYLLDPETPEIHISYTPKEQPPRFIKRITVVSHLCGNIQIFNDFHIAPLPPRPQQPKKIVPILILTGNLTENGTVDEFHTVLDAMRMWIQKKLFCLIYFVGGQHETTLFSDRKIKRLIESLKQEEIHHIQNFKSFLGIRYLATEADDDEFDITNHYKKQKKHSFGEMADFIQEDNYEILIVDRAPHTIRDVAPLKYHPDFEHRNYTDRNLDHNQNMLCHHGTPLLLDMVRLVMGERPEKLDSFHQLTTSQASRPDVNHTGPRAVIVQRRNTTNTSEEKKNGDDTDSSSFSEDENSEESGDGSDNSEDVSDEEEENMKKVKGGPKIMICSGPPGSFGATIVRKTNPDDELFSSSSSSKTPPKTVEGYTDEQELIVVNANPFCFEKNQTVWWKPITI